METLSAAPMPDDTTTLQPPRKLRSTKYPIHKKRGNAAAKKNLDRWRSNQFDQEAEEEWKNSCSSIEWRPNEQSTTTESSFNNESYQASYDSVRESYLNGFEDV